MSKIIELKGSILSLTVLRVYSADIEQTKAAIAEKIDQAPDFFVGIPVVIEFKVPPEDPMFLALLVEFLHQKQLIPTGVRTDDESVQEQASYAGLAVFPEETKKKRKQEQKETETTLENDTPQATTAMVVQGTVRSGQQIYAKGRDLMVMGSVNPGAEVVADGHVHVFGKVMGKVFAGSSGMTDARIFAKQLNPELVCIAGLYLLAEDMSAEYKKGFVEVVLEDDKLVFKRPLDE
ncbi:septum site-determining protein MinC [Hydrogenovibrio kuenenii]|uniref:septum site-determining protein MinC n=1 Tax=Hydrogenovibrio kuenenii TaxID=63658 RepID=UPI000466CA39|nr:septum site-determining protein MinC [Hydrogenovibrio kuenenii]